MFKYLKLFLGKFKAVDDTFTTLPKFLKDGTTLEEAKHLMTKARLPVKQQVAEVPMIRVLQERVMTTGNPKRKYRYFKTVLMPNVSHKPWVL